MKVYYSKVNDLYYFMCPACNVTHAISKTAHNYDGNLESPTFHGSVGWTGVPANGSGNIWCHSFVTNGTIRFESDSQHELAGKTMELPEITS